jgi:hypothetical protein
VEVEEAEGEGSDGRTELFCCCQIGEVQLNELADGLD